MASSVNKVILIGHLGADPEVRRLENGATVASFNIATSETYTDRNTNERKTLTEWHRITLWRGLAEIAEKYLRKGSQVYIEGKLKTRSYEDQDKIMRYVTEVVGDNMTLLGGRPTDGSQSSAASNTSSYQSTPQSASPSTQNNKGIADSNPEEDDLPF